MSAPSPVQSRSPWSAANSDSPPADATVTAPGGGAAGTSTPVALSWP
ncbi:MAG TPA: hypothetical protein VE526_14635 [Solirubrobacteraceae bacterium]|nr:hypothetical protein [Solirubrobacteraceae bacterium]